MKNLLTASLALSAMVAFVLSGSGCTDSADDSQFSDVSATESEKPDENAHAAHAHPSEGPHGGDLIELGNEDYHAELVHPEGHDDAHPLEHGDEDHKGGEHKEGDHKEGHDDDGDHDHAAITIYILDGSAKKTVAIDATEITLNLSHDGKPEQFKLAAMPIETDAEGKSSRFASDDKDLLEHFHEEEIHGTLVLKINGKSYRGKVAHDHEGHEGHEH
jgi:hypothetical protein